MRRNNHPERQEAAKQTAQLHLDLHHNVQHIRQTLGNSGDLVVRDLPIGANEQLHSAIIYTDGLVDTTSIQSGVIEALMSGLDQDALANAIRSDADMLNYLSNHALAVEQINETDTFDELIHSLLSGNVILLLNGYDRGLFINLSKYEHRAIMEPAVETVVRGPRESFTESLRTNTALIRRKIKDQNLRLDNRMIGRITKTDIAVMYMKGIADDHVVEQVHSRLDQIDIDGILESGYIEAYIQDVDFTPFPTVYNTERPDVIAAELLEGKVVILVDGTPFVLVVPALFISFLHSAEDYYQRADISSLIRILRFIGLFISLLAPSLYIAITTFHQEMLPTQLLIGLASQREGIPFPAFIEALVMEIVFEVLREAGLRMPRAVGQAVSIVGTLVIGQAAVNAGIVSAAMVIVVSITAIASFIYPAINMSITMRMLRFPLMGLAASFGMFGIFLGLMVLLLHMSSLKSFGVPYTAPFSPYIPDDLKDTVIRKPLWLMNTRPRLINRRNIIRQGKTSPPPAKPK
ncbi:spore germination protein [Cohnella panacarvi]|uniref:spore germination protein n=1 Tax=Cohnella panacarvi TaxID=400776 RepID=UPI0004799157|nr:spore germination protein [Cohnella panacarvi]